MKKISFKGPALICLTLIFTLLNSCTLLDKDFLVVPVQGGETINADPNLAAKLVTGVYNSLMQGDCFGNGDVHGWGFISVTTTISDDADKGSFAGDQAVPIGDIDNFTLTSTNKFCLTLWTGHYNSIATANQALRALESSSLPDTQKNQLIAEVRFLRGYLYFNLVRMYGGVPLVLRVAVSAADANSDPAFVTRASVSDVYASIIQDMQYASNHLPVKSQYQAGHVNKGTAQAFLAKVNMYLGKWDKVLAFSDSVINSTQYQLVADYATIWRQVGENSTESIFEIQTGAFNNTNLRVDNYVVCQGPRVGGLGGWNDLGYGFNGPTPNLINAYEVGDVRRDATVIFIDNSGTHKGTKLWDGFRIPSSDSVQNLYYNYKAYTSATTPPKEQYPVPQDKDRPKNIRILRYADLLLMNAEAAVHQGTGDPVGKVNAVRVRANLAPKGSVTIDDIWQERRVELAMEHDRFWDIVRQGRASQVMHAAGKSNFVAGVHELLPIPNLQIELSGGLLTQNPGY
jgi:starch-binding outer membrane protein, SusD/RagB family